MTFKEFMSSEGLYGSVKQINGPLGIINKEIKACQPVKGKGTSVGRMMAAGKVNNPARPARMGSINGPMTKPSVLK